ncbi:MAG: NAD-dependent epimerase/dehydratase family protein [Polyangiaceae bacterium]|nr:NAD-dependent epimerase/dehydratase family protein [Polyangiaceae bacterium]
MKLAIIGGTRFIGHATAAHAAERGHDVYVLHRGKHPSELATVQPIAVDRYDPSALCETLAHLAPNAVIDTRAMCSVEAECTALAMKVLGLPGVVLSSQDVYAQFGMFNGLPCPSVEPVVNEDSPLTIPFPFRELGGHDGGPDYDKKEVEKVFCDAAKDGIPGVAILRLPMVYGPRDYRRRFGTIVDALDSGLTQLPCTGGAVGRITHAHVVDVAHAVVLAVEGIRRGARVYNVGEEMTPTMRDRVEMLAHAAGRSFSWNEVQEVPPPFWMLGRLPTDFVVDSSRIRAEIGYRELTTERERLADTVQWLRQSRPEQTPLTPQ